MVTGNDDDPEGLIVDELGRDGLFPMFSNLLQQATASEDVDLYRATELAVVATGYQVSYAIGYARSPVATR